LRAKIEPADVVLSTIDIDLRASETDQVSFNFILTVKIRKFDRQIYPVHVF
jgi:hypothetical protein